MSLELAPLDWKPKAASGSHTLGTFPNQCKAMLIVATCGPKQLAEGQYRKILSVDTQPRDLQASGSPLGLPACQLVCLVHAADAMVPRQALAWLCACRAVFAGLLWRSSIASLQD